MPAKIQKCFLYRLPELWLIIITPPMRWEQKLQKQLLKNDIKELYLQKGLKN